MSVQQNLRERAERHARRKRLPTLIVLIGISILVLAQLTKLLHERLQSKPLIESATAELTTTTELASPALPANLTHLNPEQGPSNPVIPTPFSADVNQLFKDAATWPSANFKLQPQQWTHTLGTPIYFIQAADLPMLDVRLIFNAGSARDGKLPGLANLTAALLDQGADKLDVNAISEQLETLGSQLSIDAYRDMAVIQLRTLTDPAHLQPTLQLLSRILAAPNFPDSALTRIRHQLLLGLKQEQQQPAALIQKKLWQTLYPQHAYGQSPNGTNASLAAINQAHLKAFYQQYYTSANAVLAMVGAIDRPTAETISQQLLAALPVGNAAPALPAPEPINAQHIHIPFASQQTHIQIGVLGISRKDEQYAAFYLANEVLGGGGFSSRLNQVIREDAGLAYSVGSHFVPMQTQGPLMISMQTRNEKAAEALQKIDQVLAAMINVGPTESEIHSARQHLVSSYPLGLATNLSQVGQLASLAFYQLPAAHINEFPHQLMIVQSASTLPLLKQLLPPERRIIVTLGPIDPLATIQTSVAPQTAAAPTPASP